ncbi:Adenylate cyclase type 2 [Fragariocoptes setiger]|uniref:adenylate cyclase n=1 Tax=Fragariocoptes setiger TaxID=1670756 RepID=A0ABQ7SBY0_9ACAR|nr:Adenylate cyclase type 2 [Fragariocoptes setiger]
MFEMPSLPSQGRETSSDDIAAAKDHDSTRSESRSRISLCESSINGGGANGLEEIKFRYNSLVHTSQLQYFFLGTVVYSFTDLILSISFNASTIKRRIGNGDQHHVSEQRHQNNPDGTASKFRAWGYVDNAIVIIQVLLTVALAMLTLVVTVNQQLRLRRLKYLPKRDRLASWIPATTIGQIVSIILLILPYIYRTINLGMNMMYVQIQSGTRATESDFLNQSSKKSLYTNIKESHLSDYPDTSDLESSVTAFLLETALIYWPIMPVLVCLYMLPTILSNFRFKYVAGACFVPIILSLLRLAVIYGYRFVASRAAKVFLANNGDQRPNTNSKGNHSEFNQSSSRVMDVLLNEGLVWQCMADLIMEIVALTCGSLRCSTFQVEINHRIFDGARQLIEAKVNMEHQRQQQETLLLSVLPAYVADQVKRNMVKRVGSANTTSTNTTGNSDALAHHSHLASLVHNSSSSIEGHAPFLSTSNATASAGGPSSSSSTSRRGLNELYIRTYHNVSLLYADIVGFTRICTHLTSSQLVIVLNDLFSRFDQIALKHRVLRIKILGDCYYGVSGIPETAVLGSKSRSSSHNHAILCVDMGLEMIKVIRRVGTTINADGLNMRIGVHSGHIHSGVIGLKKWQFDVWSNDVSIAMHCESSGLAGRVHITKATAQQLNGSYEYEDGHGQDRDPFLASLGIDTFLIIGPRAAPENKDTSHGCSSSIIVDVKSPCKNKPNESAKRNGIDIESHSDEDDEACRAGTKPFSSIDATMVENIRIATMSTISQTLVSADKVFCYENHHDMRALSMEFRDKSLERTFASQPVRSIFRHLCACLMMIGIVHPLIQLTLICADVVTLSVSICAALFALAIVMFDREACTCDFGSTSLAHTGANNLHGRTADINASHNVPPGIGKIEGNSVSPSKIPSQLAVPTSFPKVRDQRKVPPANHSGQNDAATSHFVANCGGFDQTELTVVADPTTGLSARTSVKRRRTANKQAGIKTSSSALHQIQKYIHMHMHVSKSMTKLKKIGLFALLVLTCAVSINRIRLMPFNCALSFCDHKFKLNDDRSTINYASDIDIDSRSSSDDSQTTGTANVKLHLNYHHVDESHGNELISNIDRFKKKPLNYMTRESSQTVRLARTITKEQRETKMCDENLVKYNEISMTLVLFMITSLTPFRFSLKCVLVLLYLCIVCWIASIVDSFTANQYYAEIFNNRSANLLFPSSFHTIFRSNVAGYPSSTPDSSVIAYAASMIDLSLITMLIVFAVWCLLFDRQLEYTNRSNFLWRQRLNVDQEELECISGINKVLLENILPSHVVQHYLNIACTQSTLANGLGFGTSKQLYHEQHEGVAVMFASIPYFYEFYDESDINKQGLSCIALLNEIVCDFDKLLSKNKFSRIEKIKTIGSTYMAAAGLRPYTTATSSGLNNQEDCGIRLAISQQKTNLICMVQFATELMNALKNINKQSFQAFKLRVGISTGSVVAGVVGAQRPFYDIWGDVVNIIELSNEDLLM